MTLTLGRRAFLAHAAVGIGALYAPSVLRAENNNIPIYEISRIRKCEVNGKNYTYYKVGDFPFHIAIEDQCNLNAPFLPSDEYRTVGKPFPPSNDSAKPVVLVKGGKVGLNGNLEVYDISDGYEVRYGFSPLIHFQAQAKVSPEFLFKIDSAIKRIPEKLLEQFNNRGIKVTLGKDVGSTYYSLYPYWKTQDEAMVLPRVEDRATYISTGDCSDKRKRAHVAACYSEKSVMIPQKHEHYYSGKILDINEPTGYSISDVVAHELFHALDDFNNDNYILSYDQTFYNHKKQYVQNGQFVYRSGWYSDTPEYIAAYNLDKEKMSAELKEELAYQFCGRKDSFADAGSSLLGLRNPEAAKKFLKAFPNCAEYIRTRVLANDFGVNVSIPDVKSFYPEYLKGSQLIVTSN